MAKIQIMKVPPGPAPDYIREQWLGLEMPLAEDPIPDEKVVLKIGNQNSGGYQVKGFDAVEALKKANKLEAAHFWLPYATGNFVFKKEVCRLIA